MIILCFGKIRKFFLSVCVHSLFCESGVLQNKWRQTGLLQACYCFQLNYRTVAGESSVYTKRFFSALTWNVLQSSLVTATPMGHIRGE
jgi:hypothetical protein